MPKPLHASRLAARRFLLRTQGLRQPFATTHDALQHLGYIQIDPLNICGRMHDLILRNRVAGYREGDLGRHLHGPDREATPGRSERSGLGASERIAFEHHHPVTHILVAFPLEAWPHLLGAMRARSRHASAWLGRLTPTERRLAPALLQEIKARGPMSAEDFADAGRARTVVWGKSSLVKSTLQKLFFHGELLIAGRHKNRRCYDLPRHVLPATVLAQGEAPASETNRWLARLKLRQWRLCTLKKDELAAVGDEVRPVAIEGCPPLYCLETDARWLDGEDPAAAPPRGAGPDSEVGDERVRLLAPLDPLIYDRRLTRALWDFDYTWEAYTPAAKRVRGHYALPVLVGTELVGHVEPKANRAANKLVVASRAVRRGVSTQDATRELARWLGLK